MFLRMNKTLITICTRNNSALLQNLINSLERHDAGASYDLIIADNTSDDPKHLKLLQTLSKKYKIQTCANDRAETTFDTISRQNLNNYDYFFFVHDDTYAYKNNWLKVFIDRVNSNYSEPELMMTHLSRYPIGRVSGCSQPYRDFQKCKGYPLSSIFLKECLEILGETNIWIYKYSDQERVLYTRECLSQCGMWNLNMWESHPKFTELKETLNKNLLYPDEGMGPKDKYPNGQAWCKLMLLTEFLNSVWPLAKGFRTVGLEGNGYLEQIDGFDTPFGMDHMVHFGSPHCKRWLGSKFGCSGEDVHKKLYSNDFSFILKCNKLFEEYFK